MTQLVKHCTRGDNRVQDYRETVSWNRKVVEQGKYECAEQSWCSELERTGRRSGHSGFLHAAQYLWAEWG